MVRELIANLGATTQGTGGGATGDLNMCEEDMALFDADELAQRYVHLLAVSQEQHLEIKMLRQKVEDLKNRISLLEVDRQLMRGVMWEGK